MPSRCITPITTQVRSRRIWRWPGSWTSWSPAVRIFTATLPMASRRAHQSCRRASGPGWSARAVRMADGELLVEVAGVSKDYRALRPLRIQRLELRAGQSIALLGLDAAMAEVLVNLITGAQLPDEGEVRVFGRSTESISAVDDWVTGLDRFGLISGRALLVEQFTAEQNLALPISLDIEVMPPPIREEVRRLASEIGLSADRMA